MKVKERCASRKGVEKKAFLCEVVVVLAIMVYLSFLMKIVDDNFYYRVL